MFSVKKLAFLWYNAIVYHLIALQVNIIAPSLIQPGILSMDKKFNITIMNFKWTLYMSSNNIVQNRRDLS